MPTFRPTLRSRAALAVFSRGVLSTLYAQHRSARTLVNVQYVVAHLPVPYEVRRALHIPQESVHEGTAEAIEALSSRGLVYLSPDKRFCRITDVGARLLSVECRRLHSLRSNTRSTH